MPRMGVKFCLIAGCFLEGGTSILFGFVYTLCLLFMFMFIVVGPWSNGYQCGMQIPRPRFNFHRVPDADLGQFG